MSLVVEQNGIKSNSNAKFSALPTFNADKSAHRPKSREEHELFDAETLLGKESTGKDTEVWSSSSPSPSRRDEMCGIGSWRPDVLQKLANHRVFAVCFVVVGIVQGMVFSYFNGVITTVEKTFGIPSSTLGLILSGNDISQILCGILVTHLGGRGSRPLWVSFGMLLTAASCFMYASAQLFWGEEFSAPLTSSTNTSHALCRAPSLIEGTGDGDLGNPVRQPEDCIASSSDSHVPALVVFFVGQFISGIGSIALFSLGFTYMDDSVKKSAFPLYMAVTGTLRALGPTAGYMLASGCLRIYIHPSAAPEYNQKDPRWLGAWWLGFLIIGFLQIIITFPVLLFPKKLPAPRSKKSLHNVNNIEKSEIVEADKTDPPPAMKDLFAAFHRVLKNPMAMVYLTGIGPVILGIIGFSTFMPKYLEAQFGQTSSQASIFTGTSSMLMLLAGSFIGGMIVWKLKPRATYVCIWIMGADLVFLIGISTVMQFTCEQPSFVGVEVTKNGIDVTSACSKSCNCPPKYDPVCVGSQNFLNPCMAGCSTYDIAGDGKKVILNCTCASAPLDTEVIMGYCPGSRGQCSLFMPYVAILGISKLISSSTRIGGILVFMRSVDKRDKSLLMGLMGAFSSLFGFIPGPIIYGAVVDGTCLLWGDAGCGKKGNCWLYDLDNLRIYFHGITIICFAINLVFDVFSIAYSRKINLYSDDPPTVILGYMEGFQCGSKVKATGKTRTSSK